MTAGVTPQVVEALTVAQGWCGEEWIAQHTGLRIDQVKSALKRLSDEGKAVHTGAAGNRSWKLGEHSVALEAEDGAATPVDQAAMDVAIWASGGVVIEKDGRQICLTSAEADRLQSILRAAKPVRDEFVSIEQAAAAAAAEASA